MATNTMRCRRRRMSDRIVIAFPVLYEDKLIYDSVIRWRYVIQIEFIAKLFQETLLFIYSINYTWARIIQVLEKLINESALLESRSEWWVYGLEGMYTQLLHVSQQLTTQQNASP